MTINHCQFINLEGDPLFDVMNSSGIIVKNTSFTNNSIEEFDPSGLVRLKNIAFTGNSFDQELWETLPGQEPLAKNEATLPAEAAKVFEGAKWDGYEPVATRYYQWPLASTVVTVMQKGGHNVLCLLRGSGDMDAFRLAFANDRALYQGDRVPSLFIDDGMGFVRFEYTDGDPPHGSSEAEGYVFCSRWYWEVEMEAKADGDWEYMLLDAYRLYPEPHDPGCAYYDMMRVSMGIVDGGLRLQSRYEPYGDSWYAWETLAETDGNADTAPCDLAVFEIAKCNAGFDSLAATTNLRFEWDDWGDDGADSFDGGENAESKTITVSTAEELADAIGSNTTIILSSGVYNLSEANQSAFLTGEKY